LKSAETDTREERGFVRQSIVLEGIRLLIGKRDGNLPNLKPVTRKEKGEGGKK